MNNAVALIQAEEQSEAFAAVLASNASTSAAQHCARCCVALPSSATTSGALPDISNAKEPVEADDESDKEAVKETLQPIELCAKCVAQVSPRAAALPPPPLALLRTAADRLLEAGKAVCGCLVESSLFFSHLCFCSTRLLCMS